MVRLINDLLTSSAESGELVVTCSDLRETRNSFDDLNNKHSEPKKAVAVMSALVRTALKSFLALGMIILLGYMPLTTGRAAGNGMLVQHPSVKATPDHKMCTDVPLKNIHNI